MEPRKIFTILPFSNDFTDVSHAINEAARRSEKTTGFQYTVFRADDIAGGTIIETIQSSLREADLIIADTSGENPNVLYEIGFAKALNKPIVFIAQKGFQVPFNLSSYYFVIYDRERLLKDLVPRLTDAITSAITRPIEFTRDGIGDQAERASKPSAFVSYSHIDIDCLRRFNVHVKPLEKKGVIDIWSDTKIKAGDKWKDEISSALDRAVIAILLVSADFLASDFIVENELPPILAAAEDQGTRILPVILKPCRFARDEHLSPFQAINDPRRSLLTLPEIEQERVWDSVAQEIEIELENRIRREA